MNNKKIALGILCIIVSIVVLILPLVSKADTIKGGVVSVESTIDYKKSTDQKDISVNSTYLAGWYGNNDGYVYARSSTDTTSVIVDEAYVKFNIIDDNIKWKLGKVLLPFGFEYLSRPQTSVFITSPRGDFYGFGLHAERSYGIMNVQGSYLGSGSYSARLNGTLLNKKNMKNVTGLGFINIQDLEDEYGKFSITNSYKFRSTWFDLANLMEYTPDNGEFWSRLVVAPGVLDSVGLFGGYYNVDNMYNTLHKDVYSDKWSYGVFVDISPNATASFEWINSWGLNPVTLALTVKF